MSKSERNYLTGICAVVFVLMVPLSLLFVAEIQPEPAQPIAVAAATPKPQKAATKIQPKRKTKMVQIQQGASGIADVKSGFPFCDATGIEGDWGYEHAVDGTLVNNDFPENTGWEPIATNGAIDVPATAPLGVVSAYRHTGSCAEPVNPDPIDPDAPGIMSYGFEFEVIAATAAPPTRESAQILPDGRIEITFSAPILPTTNPAGFTIRWLDCYDKTLENGCIQSIEVSGNVATFLMNVPVKIGEEMTDRYTDGNVTDTDTNALENYSAQPITNNSDIYNTSMM